MSDRRARVTKPWLVAAAVLAAIGGVVGWLHLRRGARAAGPLASHLLPSPVSFDGCVEERLDAGSYVYVRVSRDGAGDAWVVSMGGKARAGDRVHVDAVGRAERFDSRRLGRRFDDLWFAVVRPVERTELQERTPPCASSQRPSPSPSSASPPAAASPPATDPPGPRP